MSISPATTLPLDFLEIFSSASSDSSSLTESSFRFRRISITSSWTPSIVLYSCKTPSIFTSETAVPGIEDSMIRLKAFPSVCPKPCSKGSRIILDLVGPNSSTKISVGTRKSLIMS